METKKQQLFQCMESLLKDVAPTSVLRSKVDVPKCDHDHGKFRSVFYHKIQQFNEIATRNDMMQPIKTMGYVLFENGNQCCEGAIRIGKQSCDDAIKNGSQCCDDEVQNGSKRCDGRINNVSLSCDIRIQNGSQCCEKDYQWKFIECCLETLLFVDDFITKEHLGKGCTKTQNRQQHKPNVLGVNDEKAITGILQLISTFGLWPFFSSGVSRPLSTSTISTGVIPEKRSDRIKHLIILRCLLCLLKNKTLNGVVMAHMCSDILASFIQLGFEPLKRVGDGDIKLCPHERRWCRNALQEFVTRSYQPLIIKELLILQRCSAGPTSPSLPKVKWFVQQIGQQLSKCIMAEQGVRNVIHAILDGLAETLSWQHYDSIGKVIARAPSQLSSTSEYYRLISPQLLELLKTGHQNEKHSMVCVSAVFHMLENDLNAAKKQLVGPMLGCLSTFLATDSVNIKEKELRDSILSIRNLVCTNDVIVPGPLYDIISEVCHPLFLIFSIPSEQFSELRKCCKEILTTLLKNLSSEKSACVMHVLMFGGRFNRDGVKSQNSHETSIKPVRETLVINTVNPDKSRAPTTFSHDSNNEKRNCSHDTNCYLVCNLSLEDRITAIMDALNSKDLEGFRGDVFVNVLQLLVDNVTQRCSDKEDVQNNEKLLQIDRNLDALKFNIELVSFMSALLDTFGHGVLQNTPQIISFIKAILDWSQNKQVHPDCHEGNHLSSFHDDTIDLVLMLLSTLLASDKLSASDYDVLQKLLPSLENTANHHGNRSSRAMANDIKTFIETRGSVMPEYRQVSENKSWTEDDLQSSECYNKALLDLSDPLLPSRGHALRQLSKLLKARNTCAVRDEEKLFGIFESYLKHEDTYLYLAAVDGLIALVDVHHRSVMPMLCEKFIEMKTDVFNEVASHNRMKLCEAIIRSCQQCGEMLPVYKEVVMTAFMCGVKDEDELIRASSLSGIGELCRLLSYSIRSIITEVFDCVHHVVCSDKSSEVRRASVQVLSQLLKGLDTSVFQMIPDTLKDLYKLLKLMKCSESDDMTVSHVDNALTILDEIVKDSFIQRTLIQSV